MKILWKQKQIFWARWIQSVSSHIIYSTIRYDVLVFYVYTFQIFFFLSCTL